MTLIMVTALLVPTLTRAADQKDYYTIETIDLPAGVAGETDGLSFLPNGKLAVCFYREGVWFYDPATKQWTHFAYGVHEPLGLHAVSEREVVVMQRPELTRLIDTDGDGAADEFQTLCDDFGMSGNYHEFAFGPAVGPDGAYYIALNCASSGAGIFKEVRGEFRKDGRPGRMYACVPYRGWVMRVDPKSGEMTPWALGFRSPNGIGFDAQGNMFVPDNQGDWIGTSPVYHVERGKFYGHAASLVWTDGWDKGVPKDRPVEELDKMRTRPAVQLPHGVLANSPTQVIPDTTGGKFGPFAGQVLVGEMNHSHVIRLMLEDVHGIKQGAATTLISTGLPKGISRFAFDNDGALWVAHTQRAKGWGGGKGIRKITWTGKTPMDVLTMKLTDIGFDLTFTQPIDTSAGPVTPDRFEMRRYYYEYHEKYGSDQFDTTPVTIESATLSDDRRTVSLKLADLKPGYVYDLKLGDIKADDGSDVLNRKVYYTCNVLRDGTQPPPQIPQTRPTQKVEPAKLNKTKAAKMVKVSLPDDAKVYEAEDANLLGPKVQRNNAGYTGRGFVDYSGKTGTSIAWLIDVKDEDAGKHRLVFRYALEGGKRPLQLIVNEEKVGEPLPFDGTGSWTTWKTIDAQVTLNKGRNTIVLTTVGDSGPNVDHVQVVPSK